MVLFGKELPAQSESVNKVVAEAIAKTANTVLIKEVDIEVYVMTHN